MQSCTPTMTLLKKYIILSKITHTILYVQGFPSVNMCCTPSAEVSQNWKKFAKWSQNREKVANLSQNRKRFINVSQNRKKFANWSRRRGSKEGENPGEGLRGGISRYGGDIKNVKEEKIEPTSIK